jgi:asparagine synthetase B (glutamine-hydrolysing)
MLVFDQDSCSLLKSDKEPSHYRFGEPQKPITINNTLMEQLDNLFKNSILKRVKNIPFTEQHQDVIVMFSGGLDSTILAKLLCQVLPPNVGLDLVNVSFSPQDSPDRITAILSFYELFQLRKNIRLICADYTVDQVSANQDLKKLIQPKSSHMDYNIGSALHYASKGEG